MGRDVILGGLVARVERAVGGHGGMVLIGGEPGVGKTTLLEALVARVVAGDLSVGWATSRQDAAAPPGWVIGQLAQDPRAPGLSAALTELVANDEPGAAAAEMEPASLPRLRFERAERAADALVALARRRPLLLVIDDLQWVDRTTLDLLQAVIPRARALELLVVATYRSTEAEADHPLTSVLARLDTRIEHVRVEGLDQAAVAELTAGIVGVRPSDEVAESIRRHTGGNALFVVELARFLAMQQRPLESAGPHADASMLPHGVREVLRRRIAGLSRQHREVLEAAAVAGTTFAPDLVAAACGPEHDRVHVLLVEAVERGLVEGPGDGGRYRFAHGVTRTVVYESLAGDRRRELHGRSGDALCTRDDASDAEIAYHFLRAGPERRTKAVEYARRAARGAVGQLAYEEAAGFLEQALEANTGDVELRSELMVDLGEVRRGLGDWDAAMNAFETAADLARESGAATLLARVGLAMGGDAGGFEIRLMDPRQLAVIRHALTLLSDDDVSLRSRLLARLAVATTHVEAIDQRRAWSLEAVESARNIEHPLVLVHALSSWCDAFAHPEYTAERLDVASEMLVLADRAAQPTAALLARRLRLMALLEAGDPAADIEIELFVALAQQLGQPLYQWYQPLFRGMRALSRGRLELAEELLAETEEIGIRAGSTNAAILTNAQRTALMLARHQHEDALELFERAVGDFPEVRPHPAIRAVHAHLLAGSGAPARAHAELAVILADGGSGVPPDSEHLSTLGHAAAACLLIGDVDAAAQLSRLLRPFAGRWIVEGIGAVLWGPVDLTLGRLAVLQDQPAQAARHFDDARAASARFDSLLWRSEIEHSYGTLLISGANRDAQERGAQMLQRGRAIRDESGLPPHPLIGLHAQPSDEPSSAGTSEGGPNVFRRAGRLWRLRFADRTVHVPHTKGMTDLSYLLAAPGSEVPATALLEAAAGGEASSASAGAAVLDGRARAAYRARVTELDRAVEEAEDDRDLERASRARAERDFVVDELAAAVGLHGRSRRLGDDAERARKAVTMRIRTSIRRIADEHPELGRHLDHAVRTGTRCAYDPEQPTAWRT